MNKSLPLSIYLGLCCALAGLGNDQAPDEARKYALLIGCTEYPNNRHINELSGPGNDVPLFADLLQRRFGFARESITVLLGKPDQPSGPTADRIGAAFDQLVATAAPGDQIVIMMAGHGMQLPIPATQADPFDPKNLEPDGLDEVFLPADAASWTNGDLPNSLRDDRICAWLQQLKQRGAAVWIIFDCCHSGTMTRSVEDLERNRSVTPWALGVPDAELEKAQEKVVAAQRAQGTAEAEELPLEFAAEESAEGSITAFYAAQPYEVAPELPRPSDAPRTRSHYYGLLSYTLCQTLEQSQGRLTYRDLARRIISRYVAERGSRGPTPLFDGDMGLEVLGTSAGQRVAIYTERRGANVQLSAGSLAGLVPGTVLAVYPTASAAQTAAAYVRVTAATPTTAEIESTDFKEIKAVPLDQLPDAARCDIVVQDLGDMRLRIGVAGAESAETAEARAKLEEALAALPAEVAALVEQVESPADAEWVLWPVDPATARNRFAVDLAEPSVLLIPGDGRAEPQAAVGPDASAGEKPARHVRPMVLGQYAVNETKRLASELSRDIKKIFTWQNTWRVAVSMTEGATTEGGAISFKVTPTPAEPTDASEAPSSVLHAGDQVYLHIENTSIRQQWVSLLYLGADYSIDECFTMALKPGQKLQPYKATINDESIGPEGVIVLSVSVPVQKNQPDYSFLVQEPLGVGDRAWNSPNPETPFEQLMVSVSAATGVRQRAVTFEEPTNPQVQSWTWVTAPKSP